jgi:hypothetical protein
VNCSQARAILTAYRELKNGEVDTIELDVHLEECASCRQELARYTFIGEQLRSLPTIEPPPDMQTKLMHVLAKEQLEFIRRSVPGTVTTPEFLKPYLQEHAQPTHTSDLISAFSTADTGPLPIIQAKRKRRSRSHMSQFAVLGLAAMLLMVLMMGGLTSLLMIAHNNLQVATSINPANLHQPAEVEQAIYTTSTPYQHVVSAVADRANIYYSAYRDGAETPWMLERLDRATKISTPLLSIANANPLIVLGSSSGSVVWLQFDGLKLKPQNNPSKYGLHPYVIPWSLHYLSLEQQQQVSLGIPTDSEVILKGAFDQDMASNWVTTPVQGIRFIQNSLLVAMTDSNGISHLIRYELNTVGKPSMTEIATAAPGHILTSPTANSDGTQIYWSEEWLSSSGILNSNIWIQQAVEAPPSHGYWAPHKVIIKQLFSSDGMSFRPQVVDNTLFMLRTASQVNLAQGTPTTTGTATATPTPASSPNTSAIPRTDTSIYAAPLDASVRGSILMQPLNGDPTVSPTAMSNTGASSLQAGSDFVLWQEDKGYKMYDVQVGLGVPVGNILDGATLLAVNGASTVWMVNNGANATSNAKPLVTLMAFNWPTK